MDITNMLNGKDPAAVAAAAKRQYQQHAAQGVSYSAPPQPQPSVPTLASNYVQQPFENTYMQQPRRDSHREDAQNDGSNSRHGSIGGLKAFGCTTCGKGFARRSDLARHERIHTGDRPHVCPERGCNKPFIQRSALTVHMRVHSGEKPHMCERCGKPFSDSSSLARHRRIHSGKRPYKCPFADCQKTFTRRTTLTRHQNHHTGTVEEAAAATAAVLASRTPGQQRLDSERGNISDTASMASGTTRTPSPGERNLPLSPLSDVPHMPDFNHMPQLSHQPSIPSYTSGDCLPPHIRAGLQQPSPRSSPSASSPTLSAFGGTNHRPSLTSHPMLPVLEPPAYHDLRQPSSGTSSPHLGNAGWQSPAHLSGLPSPGHNDPCMYHEAPYGPSQHLYYPSSNMRRPTSTEPDQYELKPRLPSSGAVWTSMG